MGLITIEPGDMIATKDGKTMRVLSVYKTGEDIYKVEGIDDNEPIPMRRSAFSAEIARVIKKAKVAEANVSRETKEAA